MRKFLAIIFILISVGIYYYYTGEKKLLKEEKQTEFDRIVEMSAKEEIFYNPDEVMIVNNKIISYLYGGKVKSEEIEPLITIQRSLFDNELLQINPIELQVEKVKSKIEEYKEKEYVIISIKQRSAQYEENNKNISRVKVIQYMTGGIDNYLEYYLRKQIDNTWKILGWETVDEFSISEELEL